MGVHLAQMGVHPLPQIVNNDKRSAREQGEDRAGGSRTVAEESACFAPATIADSRVSHGLGIHKARSDLMDLKCHVLILQNLDPKASILKCQELQLGACFVEMTRCCWVSKKLPVGVNIGIL